MNKTPGHPEKPPPDPAEQALRDSEQRYRSLLKAIDQGFCIIQMLFNENGDPSDYRFLETNPAFEKHTGLEQAVGRTMRQLVPEHEEHWFRIYGKVASTGEAIRFENLAHGLNRWFDVFAYRVGQPRERKVALLFSDITDRKRAEDALRESEQRLRLILQSATDYAIFTLGLDNRVTTWNTGARRLLGYEDEEIIGRSGVIIFTPEDRQAGATEHEMNKAREHGRAENERWHLRKDGSRFWGSGLMMPLRDPNGGHRGYLKIMRDMTEQRRAEEKIKSLNNTLERRVAERTAEAEQRADQLRRLTAELTHTEQRERRRIAQVLHDHLQQLLVAAKLQVGLARGTTDDADLNQSLQQALDLLTESIDASRSLTVELSPPVLYDGNMAAALDWLSQWMADKHNLNVEVKVDQAIPRITENLRVFLFTAVRELLFNVAKHARVDRARLAMDRIEGHRLRIIIEDEGVGFDPAAVAEQDAGGGFGLFSIRERLELLGGRLHIQSTPGQGTRTILIAPVRWAETAEVAEEAKTAEKTEKGEMTAPPQPDGDRDTIRVLLADDHLILRQGLVGLMDDEADIEVIGEASDGRETVDLARRLQPHIVIMDVNMPALNGVEATRRIKADLPHIKIIGLSMHESRTMAAAMTAAGASAYLNKGGATETLCDTIRQIATP